MLRNLTRMGIVLILAAFVASCSKSTNSGGTAPTLVAPTFTGPTASTSADTSEAAQLAIGAATSFNAIASGYVALFTGLPGGSQSGNTWTWSGTSAGVTDTWTATSGSNGYNWKLVRAGGTFSNWTALTGYESNDGKTGNWVLYNLNSPIVEDSVGWSTDSNNNLNGTIIECDTTGIVTAALVFTGNATNHTGELKVYGGPISSLYEGWDIIWTASGGTWTEYYGGQTIGTGSW